MYFDEEAFDRFVGYHAKKGAEGYRDETESKRDTPFATADMGDLESRAADEHNKNLDTNFCGAKKSQLSMPTMRLHHKPMSVIPMK